MNEATSVRLAGVHTREPADGPHSESRTIPATFPATMAW